MKTIKTKVCLKDLKGDNLKDSSEQDFTLGTVLSVILSGQVSNPTLGYVLAKKFATEDEVDLKAEDIVFIKKELEDNKMFTALVIGQVIEILESK